MVTKAQLATAFKQVSVDIRGRKVTASKKLGPDDYPSVYINYAGGMIDLAKTEQEITDLRDACEFALAKLKVD